MEQIQFENQPQEVEVQEVEVQEKKQRVYLRSKKNKIHLSKYVEKFNELLFKVDAILLDKKKNFKDGVKELSSIRNSIEDLKKDIPYLTKVVKKENTEKKPVFFNKPKRITDEFAEFLGIEKGTELTRFEASSAIYVYIFNSEENSKESRLRWKYLNENVRDLRNPTNKSIILPDEALSKILKYNEYVEQVSRGEIFVSSTCKETGLKNKVVVTTPELKFWVITKLLSNLFVKE